MRSSTGLFLTKVLVRPEIRDTSAEFVSVVLCPDVDGDNDVDSQDLQAIVRELGHAAAASPADLDANGVVDIMDLATSARRFGLTCS